MFANPTRRTMQFAKSLDHQRVSAATGRRRKSRSATSSLRRNRRSHLETLEKRNLLTTFALGDIGKGVGVSDNATGTGYIMFSEQSVHNRFNPKPIITNSDHLIGVRYEGGQWEFNNNNEWNDFDPEPNDRLLAQVDFDLDTIDSYQCDSGTIQGIDFGFANDDLTFAANVWSGGFGLGEFTVDGTTFDDDWTVCGAFNAISPDTGEVDFITSETALMLRGHFAPQTDLQVTVAGTTYDLGVDPQLTHVGPKWTLDLTAAADQLPDGTHNVSISVPGGTNIDTGSIRVDTSPPAVTIDSISEDTEVGGDFITSDPRLIVQGTFTQASDLLVEVNGVGYDLVGNPLLTSDGDGNWTLDLSTVPLPPGGHDIVATVSDTANNQVVENQPIQIIGVSIDAVTQDTGVVGDFITADTTVAFSGVYTAGTDLSFDFNGTIYDLNSPEVTTNGNTWSLDLTAIPLDQGNHELTATVSDATGHVFFDSRTLVIDDACNIAESFELFDLNDNPISPLASVFVDGEGNATYDLDLESRKIATNNVFYVDETATGTGDGSSWENAFTDLHDALTTGKDNNIPHGTFYVAPGTYRWGDTGISQNPNDPTDFVKFKMNVIGAGMGQTIIQNNGTDDYAGQVRGRDAYIEGLTFVGGTITFDSRNVPNLTIVDSEFTGATSGDGTNIVNAETVVNVGSIAHHNESDGFSYTDNNNTLMKVFEADTQAYDNGLDQLWNSQGSTVHKTVDIVRVNNVYERNPTNISDVSTGVSWNVGVIARDALANDQGGEYLNFNVSNGGTAWIIGGDFSEGIALPTVVNAQPGAQIRYVSQFGTLDPATHVISGEAFVDDSPLVPVSVPCTAEVSIDKISLDTGDDEDFVTFDQELLIHGSLAGSGLEINFDGTVYTEASPELTVNDFDWTLDLTAITLPHGIYTVTASVTDSFGGTASDNANIQIDCLTPHYQLVNNPVLQTIGNDTAVYVDSAGNGTAVIDLEARKVVSSNVYYVNAAFNGDGSLSNPFADIPDAFAAIDAAGQSDAVIHVAGGEYTWGTAIDPDFNTTFDASLTIIGAGPEVTRVRQQAADHTAAIFNEPGRSLYLEGMQFIGLGSSGIKNFNENTFDARSGAHLTVVDSQFRDSTDGDGLFVSNFDTVVVHGVRSVNNDSDGFSYTSVDVGGDPMAVMEIDVVAAGNGKNGKAFSQGSTIHRQTQIVRVNSLYANNPLNIEDTGLTSWNVNIEAMNPTVERSEGLLNFMVRGDKQEVTDGTAWFISGSYNDGGIAYAKTSNANDEAQTEIYGSIRYTSLFDIDAHPPAVLGADSPGSVVHDPANDLPIHLVYPGCGAPYVSDISEDRGVLGDFITNDQNLLVRGGWGGWDSDETLRVIADGTAYDLGTDSELTMDAEGHWTLDLTAQTFGEGLHTIDVQLVDGPAATQWYAQTFEIDLTPPPAPTIDAIDEDTGVPGDFDTDDRQLVFFGTWTEQSGSLQITVGGATYILGQDTELRTDGEGAWTLDLSAEVLIPGTQTITAEVIDDAGNIASATQSLTVNLSDLIPLGAVNRGISAFDYAEGFGYVLHSQESVFTRFAANPPLNGNSDQLITVRYSDGNWEYNDNKNWHVFQPALGDRLLASIDFNDDKINSLQGAVGTVFGIGQGYDDGDLTFAADTWNGGFNNGEFTVDGTFYTVPDDASGESFAIGAVNKGIGTWDYLDGVGYLLYSVENLFDRFAAEPPQNGNSDHVISVRNDDGQWQYNNNDQGWHDFAPAAGDRLLASVDFSNDTVTSLEGLSGNIAGIEQGFDDGDIEFTVNQWNDKFNTGEFGVEGTYFTVLSGGSSNQTVILGAVNKGVGAWDYFDGTGYIVFSQQSVHDRFAGSNPPIAGNSDHLVAIQFVDGQWHYDTNMELIPFTPNASDRLIAAVDFGADTIASLQGANGSVEGISQGFIDGDLTFEANLWDGRFNTGEFYIGGTFFTISPPPQASALSVSPSPVLSQPGPNESEPFDPAAGEAGYNHFHNYDNGSDVDANDQVTALDALLVINFLRREIETGETGVSLDLNGDPEEASELYDVSNDQEVTALDALLVINSLRRAQLAEGESAAAASVAPPPPAHASAFDAAFQSWNDSDQDDEQLF